MGRDISNDGTVVVRSSIALLQERFRELQRVKVMREEREFLNRRALTLSEPNHPMNYEPEATRSLIYPNARDDHHVQLTHGHRSPSPSSLSVWPTLQLQKRKREEEYYIHKRRRKIIDEIPLLINLWPTVTDTSSSSSSLVETCSSNKFENSECESDDVDTSLHL